VSYLSESERARLTARIAQKTAQLVIANATYEKLLAQDTQEYRFNSGEAAQSAVKRRIGELADQIDNLEAQIDRDNARLNSAAGLTTLVLRRQ
jgi:anaerobic ribonucleoside-triphosphate reductase